MLRVALDGRNRRRARATSATASPRPASRWSTPIGWLARWWRPARLRSPPLPHGSVRPSSTSEAPSAARARGLVFADAQAREDLEAIVHPAVRRGIDAFFAGQTPLTELAVADIPLLFETNRAADFDAVVVAACPPEMQVARVMARDGVTEEAVRQRMAAQLPIEAKVRRADYVIDTSGSFQDTDAAVDRVLDELRARR